MAKKLHKYPILAGTLILSAAGMLTRLIGFFYKIYLADKIGTTELGIYQLIFPIYGLCFTVYGAGIQTALSQLIASEEGYHGNTLRPANTKQILTHALCISVGLALFLSGMVSFFAEPIARHFLLEIRCTSSLRILTILFPFCAVTACLNGYYYGVKKTGTPAFTQLIEQIARVLFVYLVSNLFILRGKEVTCELAVAGIVAGEVISNFFILICYCFHSRIKNKKTQASHPAKDNEPVKKKNSSVQSAMAKNIRQKNYKKTLTQLCYLAIPLTATKLITNVLHSAETILIPGMLKRYGLDAATALSIYGVLTGMAMTFLLFPSTITSSFAVLLLPAISEEQAKHNYKKINKMVNVTLKYSLLVGILFACLFFLYGPMLGNVFFHNELCGRFLVILSWLSPFIYLSTTISSIINGLGKTNYTFFSTIAGLGIRILFVVICIPRYGIHGYLVGMLISQILITMIEIYLLKKLVPYTFDSTNLLLLPGLSIIASGGMGLFVSHYLLARLPQLIRLVAGGGITCICFILFLLAFHICGRKDFA